MTKGFSPRLLKCTVNYDICFPRNTLFVIQDQFDCNQWWQLEHSMKLKGKEMKLLRHEMLVDLVTETSPMAGAVQYKKVHLAQQFDLVSRVGQPCQFPSYSFLEPWWSEMHAVVTTHYLVKGHMMYSARL